MGNHLIRKRRRNVGFRSFVATWVLPIGLYRGIKRVVTRTQQRERVLTLVHSNRARISNLDSLRFSEKREFHWVPVEKCISGTGAGFNSGQHHYVRYLAEGIESLRKYYELRVPRDSFEVLFDQAPSDYRNKHDGIWRKPWEMSVVPIQRANAMETNQEWGPTSARKLMLEASRLDQLVNSVSARGYVAYPDELFAFPVYQLLVDDSDSTCEKYRLKISGSHRFATLVHLGWKQIPVTPNPYSPREIRLGDADKWPGVIDGSFSELAARHFFQLYFRSQKLQFLEGW